MNTLRKKRSKAGRRGGRSTLTKYGVDHFREIGKRGASVFHKRYRLEPVNISNFAIVNRETGEVKAFLNGVPF